MIQEIRVGREIGMDVLGEILNLQKGVVDVKICRVYRLEGISEAEATRLAADLFTDNIIETYTVNTPFFKKGAYIINVAYKPGVMNPESASIKEKAARDLGIKLVAADSSTEYAFFGNPSEEDIKFICDHLLMNKVVECIVLEKPTTLLLTGNAGKIATIPLRFLGDEALMELSRDKLFLDLEEMGAIQKKFLTLGRDPTDGELELIAQTWSEHCNHKTFRARLNAGGVEKEPLMVRLKRTVEKFGEGVLSAFDDNSGVIEFYEDLAICGKVETHNSPCAIEPYGGAATGSGGVFRDIMGTGQGAKVIASTDIFCFAPPDLDPEKLPAGCLPPRYLLRRVVAGVRDYGNRMGIPTNNGSVHFHEDFRAKPTVIVGAYGIIPVDRCKKGKPQPGDRIIVIGGRTGCDGIHGATFSSGEMTERTVSVNSSAVQIGNAIEEKRMGDAIIAARDEGLIRAITDCGAGGFSSAIGEMANEIGAHVLLERAPLKYSGLAPWEIWISESQERMIVAVAPENEENFFKICKALNVEATDIGVFGLASTSESFLFVSYDNEALCYLDMDFLHNGMPKRTLEANWARPVFEEPEISEPSNWREVCEAVLSHPNVCSKEPIVRMYDHSVQGTSVLVPFSGAKHDGPNDGAIMRPVLGKPYGLAISHGMNPVLNRIDPYWGSIWAGVEALANFVSVGGNPSEAKLIDNFIWPFPDVHELGALDMAVDACVDFSKAFGIPFVSGKDSLSSTYRGKDGVIKIPPVLCISVFGRIPDVRKTISADFKEVGSVIMLVATRNIEEMAGSVYYDLHGIVGNNLPKVNLSKTANRFKQVYRLIQEGVILSCHDISEGGLLASVCEMCFGGGVGAYLDFTHTSADIDLLDFYLLNETPGCFLVEVREKDVHRISMSDMRSENIGYTIKSRDLSVSCGRNIFRFGLDSLKNVWQKPMKEVFS